MPRSGMYPGLLGVILGARYVVGRKQPLYCTLESSMDIMETIKEQVTSNRVLLYMKGSPNQPQCGFSARAVQALASVGERFAYVDILSNPEIRANLPIYANWPTFPQLWVDGELIGGCDIIAEMETSGELAEAIKAGAGDSA